MCFFIRALLPKYSPWARIQVPSTLGYLYVLPNIHCPEILSFLPNRQKITQQTVLACWSIKCFNSPTRRRCHGKKQMGFSFSFHSPLLHTHTLHFDLAWLTWSFQFLVKLGWGVLPYSVTHDLAAASILFRDRSSSRRSTALNFQ